MTNDVTTPPDWVLLEAARQCGWVDKIDHLKSVYANPPPYLGGVCFRALCDALVAPPIEKPEDPLAQAKLKVAREACARDAEARGWPGTADGFRNGDLDDNGSVVPCALRAIDLWIERECREVAR